MWKHGPGPKVAVGSAYGIVVHHGRRDPHHEDMRNRPA